VVERQGYGVSGILLADRELRTEPAHLTIVGPKDNAAARELFAAALRSAPSFTRLEWFDAIEGPLPRADVEYPALPEPAAFFCVNGACSLPIREPGQLALKLSGAK
jgi:uncharacterized protein YyaL (SSP411 family)